MWVMTNMKVLGHCYLQIGHTKTSCTNRLHPFKHAFLNLELATCTSVAGVELRGVVTIDS